MYFIFSRYYVKIGMNYKDILQKMKYRQLFIIRYLLIDKNVIKIGMI